jgi:NTP pyrophosphatase (non-canonical NTP hydrolase)
MPDSIEIGPTDWYGELLNLTRAVERRFGSTGGVYPMVSRLAEEMGELAQRVNHHEDMGVKVEKYGTPNVSDIAHEVHDVILAALTIADHYNAAAELRAITVRRSQRYRARGLMTPE